MMNNLLDLAKRCQDAIGPDRVLDGDIALALFGIEHCRYIDIPAVTSSLDAAASLIPTDHDWVLEHINGGLTIGARVGHNDPDRTSWGETAALALCGAALRARASLAESIQ